MFRAACFVLLFFFALPFPCVSQNKSKVDSLRRVFLQMKPVNGLRDTSRANVCNILYMEYVNNTPDSAMKYAQLQLEISDSIGYKKGMALAYNNIGVIYKNKGDYVKSLEALQFALDIRIKIQDKRGLANTYINLGNVHDRQGKFAEALENYNAALAVFTELKDNMGIATCHNNIGIVHKERGEYDEALKSYRVSLDMRIAADNKPGIAIAHNNIAGVLVKQGEYEAALENYFASLKIKKELDDLYGLGVTYNNIGRVYFFLGQYDKALDYEMKGLAIIEKLGALDRLMDNYEMLYLIDSARGDFAGAFRYHKLFVQTKDSVYNIEKTKRITQLEMNYKFAQEHEADSIMHANENQMHQYDLQRQKTFNYLGLVGIALVLLILFFVYRNYNNQRKANARLKETQAQLVQQEKLASLGQLTAGIAHEMRNPLNFVNNFSQVSSELVDEIINAENDVQRIEIGDSLKNNLERIHYHGMRADGIVKAMLEHSRSGDGDKQLIDFNRIANETISLSEAAMRTAWPGFDCAIKKDTDPAGAEVNIVHGDMMRVMLNLLNNAFYAVHERSKTAGAGYLPCVSVTTKRIRNQVVITIRDNGTGIPENIRAKIFNPFFTTKSGSGTGLGLSFTHDVIKAHGGEIKVESKENEFTEFTITLV
jgi:two-component system, NtrC family, sensor kinase